MEGETFPNSTSPKAATLSVDSIKRNADSLSEYVSDESAKLIVANIKSHAEIISKFINENDFTEIFNFDKATLPYDGREANANPATVPTTNYSNLSGLDNDNNYPVTSVDYRIDTRNDSTTGLVTPHSSGLGGYPDQTSSPRQNSQLPETPVAAQWSTPPKPVHQRVSRPTLAFAPHSDASEPDDTSGHKKRKLDHPPVFETLHPHIRKEFDVYYAINPNPPPALYDHIARHLSTLCRVNIPRSMVEDWYCERRENPNLPNSLLNAVDIGSLAGQPSTCKDDSAYISGSMDLEQSMSVTPQRNASQQDIPDPQHSTPSVLDGKMSSDKGLRCPVDGCELAPVPSYSKWEKHMRVHWPVKHGCLWCYVKSAPDAGNFHCLCKKRHPKDDTMFSQILECIRHDKQELNKIRGNKNHWWQNNNIIPKGPKAGRFGEHMRKDHSDVVKSPDFSYDCILDWWIQIPYPETEAKCKNCNRFFESWDKLIDHISTVHFPQRSTGRGFLPAAEPHDDYRDSNGGSAGHGAPSNDRYKGPSQGGGPSEPRGHGAHSSPPPAAGDMNGRQRPAEPQYTGSYGAGTQVCEVSTAVPESLIGGDLGLLDDHHGLGLWQLRSLQDFDFVGSQFGIQMPYWSPIGKDIEPISLELGDEMLATREALQVVHLKDLGKGATGVVDMVWDPVPRKELARKTLRLGPKVSIIAILPKIRREIQALASLRHSHIINLMSAWVTSDTMQLMIFPAANDHLRGFLDGFVPAVHDPLAPVLREAEMVDRVATWISCLSSALAYMHSVGITHGDIKPQNILVRGNHIWLGDFGAAEFDCWTTFEPDKEASGWATPMYCSPEVRSKRRRNRAADIWSFGCVLLEMATWLAGYPVQALQDHRGSAKAKPYHVGLKTTNQWVAKLRKCYEVTTQLRNKQYILDTILDMLIAESRSRITASEVFERLTPGGGQAGECACRTALPSTTDEIIKEDTGIFPSGALSTLRETEIDVIAAMKEPHGQITTFKHWGKMADSCTTEPLTPDLNGNIVARRYRPDKHSAASRAFEMEMELARLGLSRAYNVTDDRLASSVDKSQAVTGSAQLTNTADRREWYWFPTEVR